MFLDSSKLARLAGRAAGEIVSVRREYRVTGARSPVVDLGDVIAGRYHLLRRIGGGAHGTVFEAEDALLEEHVAIKILTPAGALSPDLVERFRREAKAARRIASRHALRVFDFNRTPEGMPYIVMELLKGEDLATLLERCRVLTVKEAATIVRDACDAVGEAHEMGIVHRDLKPANIFLAQRLGGGITVKVLDFGIAKLDSGLSGSTNHDKDMTGELRFGTLPYMSPEQLRMTRDTDARADVWSLGVVLYRLVTGELPFDGESQWEIGPKIVSASPKAPSSRLQGIPRAFESIVAQCLKKDRTRRYASARHLAEDLTALLDSDQEAPSHPVVVNHPNPGAESTPGLPGPVAPTTLLSPEPGALVSAAHFASTTGQSSNLKKRHSIKWPALAALGIAAIMYFFVLRPILTTPSLDGISKPMLAVSPAGEPKTGVDAVPSSLASFAVSTAEAMEADESPAAVAELPPASSSTPASSSSAGTRPVVIQPVRTPDTAPYRPLASSPPPRTTANPEPPKPTVSPSATPATLPNNPKQSNTSPGSRSRVDPKGAALQ